jgi:hypothetical protein
MDQAGMAEHALGSKSSGNKTAKKPQPMKEFHVKQLHDGTYHIQKHHGNGTDMMPVKPVEEGSAHDLDGVHDHLEEHMGNSGHADGEKGGVTKDAGFRDGEKEGEKKQGHESKPKKEKGKDTSEESEKPEHGETEEE